MVMVLDDQAAVTPAGSPSGVPIPVAPVVVCVILVIVLFKQTVGVEDAVDTVLEDCNNEVVVDEVNV